MRVLDEHRGWLRHLAPLAAIVLVAVVVAVSGAGVAAGDRPARPVGGGTAGSTGPAGSAHALSRLPMQAQSVISSTFGAADARFAPRRRAGGFGLAGGNTTAAFGRAGITVSSDGAHVSLGLQAIGRPGRLRRPALVAPRVRSHHVVYARGSGVSEWYAAGPLGLEQGFRLAHRPAGRSGAVTLALGVRGLRARLRGSGVEFLARSGRVALRYGALVARDARGRRLPAWISISGSRLVLAVDDRGARYPLVIDPFIQQGSKLTAGDESGEAGFGSAVAVSADGNTALIGGSADNNDNGAAWVFTRSGGTWTQQGPKLTPSDQSSPSQFGVSVALSADGNTALIGGDDDNSVGAAWVFTRSGSTWTQQGPKLNNANVNSFGSSVALSGDGSTALIGALDDNNNVGSASVFTRSGSTWTQQGPVLSGGGESGQGNFGSSVALSDDGNTALIGGFSDNNFVGAAWVFTRSASTWTQEGPKLTASDESGAGDFGGAVALSGDGRTALIGGSNDGTQGAAWIFTAGETFTQRGPKLVPTDASGQGANFGSSVALSADGGTALIGGIGDGGAGAAWLFAVGTATQQGPKLTASDAIGNANVGASVALSADGSTALVGGNGDNRSVGAAWVFAAKNQSVYWDNPQLGSIGTDAGPPSQVDQSFITGIGQTHRVGVAADSQHLYWTAGGFIARANLDGSDVNQQFVPIQEAATSVAVDGQHIYWTAGPFIGRANLDGSGVIEHFITVAGGSLSGLAVDAQHIYWKDGAHETIGLADLDGTNVDQNFITGTGGEGGIAVDGQHVYWTRVVGNTRPFGGAIGRANLDGSGVDQNFITGASEPSGITVDAAHLYWANSFDCDFQNDPVTMCTGGTIGRANLDGSGVDQKFTTADQATGPGCGTDPQTRCGPTSVTVATLPDGSAALYWDNPQQGMIGRETIDGSPGNVNQSLVTGIGQLDHFGVAVDGQHLYWSSGQSIGRANRDGTGVQRQFIQIARATQYLTVDDQHIYWTDGTNIGRANLDGTGVDNTFITVAGATLNGIAVDSSHIYWADSRHNTIGRANLDGSGVDPSFIAGTGQVMEGVAVDGQHVYWTQLDAGLPAVGSVGRANLDGTDADGSFITGAPDPEGMAVDFDHIYWANAFDCDYHTDPVSSCAGGTIARANLDGSGVNQSFVTAAETAGPGCGTSPETRCGPGSVAVNPPTQPDCLRTSSIPAPPPGGAVFAQPLDPASSDANVVVIPAGTSWTGPGSCTGIAQGSDAVMSHPTSVSVSPDAAVVLRDQPAGLVSAWGAQNAGAGNPAPVLFPGRSDWQTTEAGMVAPQQLLETENGCPECELPNNIQFTPGSPSPDVAYQGDVSGAVMNGARLTGSFHGWNFTGTQLGGATLNGADVSGAAFDGADLRGAQLTSLETDTGTSFANVRIGALNGECTQFKDTNLVGTGLIPVKADLLVSGCASSPLLPGSSVGLDLLNLMTLTDGATIDYANAQFLVTAANRGVLAGAALNGIDLAGASFVGFPADLENTQFNGASLQGTSFQLADLAGAEFESAIAPAASFEDANLNGAKFSQVTQTSPSTNLHNADFIDADVTGASFQSADISDAVFDDALAAGTDFNSVLATGTRFAGAHIYGDGQAFDQARDLSGADFVGAVLGGSEDGAGGFDLTGAVLSGANFDHAQCIACNFTNANLQGATFSGTYLPGAQLSSAKTLQDASFDGSWLYCGDTSDDQCIGPGTTQPQWPVALGSQESYGPVPFTTTTLTEGEFTNVTVCPDGRPPSANGCQGQLFPTGSLTLPAPCSAVALDACVTPTSTVFDGTTVTGGAPISVVPAAPPTWSSAVTSQGYYVGFKDGTVELVGGNAPNAVVAHSPDPAGLAIGLDGSLYIADPTLHEVRRLDPSSGTLSIVAGTGAACGSSTASCGDGGQATAAMLSGPSGVWASPSGELFIADGQRGIREVLPNGTITTVGPKPGTDNVVSVAGDADGNLYAATNNPDLILQVDLASGAVTTVVGTGTSGYNGNVDSDNNLLPGTQVQINHPQGLSVTLGGEVVFADTGNQLIRAFVPSAGTVIDDLGGLIPKDGVPQGGFNGDGNVANKTEFDNPAAVTVTRGALLVVADTGNARVRQIGPNPLPAPTGGTLGTSPPLGENPPASPVSPPVNPAPGRPAQHQPGRLPKPLPTNHFTLSKIRTGRDGTLTFAVKVPGPGAIDVLASAWNDNLAPATVRLRPGPHRFVYARGHRTAGRATVLHLRVAPNARGRRLVRHHTYRVTLRLWISYTPKGGRPRSVGVYGLHLPG